jgi:hypothetical protein
MSPGPRLGSDVRPDAVGKPTLRNPLVVGALAAITVGLYGVFWYYAANQQLRELGRIRGAGSLDVKPGVSTLAVSFPFIASVLGVILDTSYGVRLALLLVTGIPFAVSWYRTVKRIYAAQQIEHAARRISGWVVLVLFCVTLAPVPSFAGIADDVSVWVVATAALFLAYTYLQQQFNVIWMAYALSPGGNRSPE